MSDDERPDAAQPNVVGGPTRRRGDGGDLMPAMRFLRPAPSLGTPFRRFWWSFVISALGDGALLSAGPLLVSRETSDPALVAGAAFVTQLPFLLLSVVAGAFVDRLDRRRVVVAASALRGCSLTLLTAAVAVDRASIAVIYGCLFVLGVGDVLGQNAGSALLPALVPPEDLARANARIFGAFTVSDQLVGPPLGAALFVVGAALPFGLDAATFFVAALLVYGIRLPASATADERADKSSRLLAEMRAGVRWLWHHHVVRMLAVTLCIMNITFMGTMAVFVLYAKQRLGLGATGYGLLLTVSAVGGLVGTGFAARLERRFGPGNLLRAGLVIEGLTHVGLASTTDPWVAGAIMTVFGVHALVWGVVTVTIRQRAVPDEFRGRVNGVYALFSVGGAALGALSGGWIARGWGITAPFWFAAVVIAVLTAVVWRTFGRRLAREVGIEVGTG
jgi:MFS family permease